LVVGAILTTLGVLSYHLRRARPSPEVLVARHFPNAQLIDRGPAPAIEVQRADGSIVKLSDLRGKVVFVNFWATWCAPCREEIPDLEKLAELMRHVPFEILAVSQDDDWAAINGFFGGRKPKMLVGLDTTKKLAERYGTEKLPETYVVDRDGRLRLRFVNVAKWTDPHIHRYLEWLATDGS
jgi:thiol-disulfide isomerase/thioredoxin